MPCVSMRSVSAAHWQNSWQASDDWQLRRSVVATTIDARRAAPLPHDVRIVVDLHAGGTPLTGHTSHHESFHSNESAGAN